MRIFIIITLVVGLILSAVVQAAEPTLEAAVAKRMNSLLSDTVNEGEGYVQVSGQTCSTQPHKTLPKTDVVKCDVTFEVEYGEAKCGASCFLIFTVQNKNLKALKSNTTLENACLEDLSSTYCD